MDYVLTICSTLAEVSQFCSRIPQRQSRLLIFPRDFLSSYQGKPVSAGCFSSRGYICNPPSALSSQIIIFAHSKINASRYACCLNFFARKCESAKTKPTAPFVALTGFCRVLLSPLFFPLSNHNMACKPLILLDFIRIYSLTYTVIRGIINI